MRLLLATMLVLFVCATAQAFDTDTPFVTKTTVTYGAWVVPHRYVVPVVPVVPVTPYQPRVVVPDRVPVPLPPNARAHIRYRPVLGGYVYRVIWY